MRTDNIHVRIDSSATVADEVDQKQTHPLTVLHYPLGDVYSIISQLPNLERPETFDRQAQSEISEVRVDHMMLAKNVAMLPYTIHTQGPRFC